MVDCFYTIRTVDGKKYSYNSRNRTLISTYKDVMDYDYVEVTKWAKDTIVLINTKHIVSIERW
ncbi:hypothetical protein HOR18_gp188 [Staphylococcus phage vB_SscM-1]|uniref:Uncharacterized protein n=2 Tax=Sciuriunavirus SscM1 TaxID=2734053 RepID=A0A1X9IA11_9CAUD|nr:hypothetical protein HOR18_gp188 [Staphylococcus phage vB_SscM-1]ANT44851.1 hypothetical protein vB_SscM-1_187 [Staphylococcus phage vB_SscM-1]ANT45053.1 hypothetical protein vB_SscM-2_186 [Staphylococcus phage vB_SscM-2]